ncbi:MAG: type I methionyl aminopeptidase [Candidatus Cloacimonadota bacterium]|nr:MAG: type I methionyl aminopeptidase [Candidatus Cloacimonadota bacterium]PIE78588.1 MAG: type I methionyl aminopeptidase [Candidatus Delongbacteria bacterium]
MITIKNKDEIIKMRAAGNLAANVLVYIEPFVVEGISTEKLDDLCREYIYKHGGIPAPLNYHGFPKSSCTSINNVVCHGIPSPKEILKSGDIVNIDITVILDGYHGDTSKTFMIGEVSEADKLLVERTYKAMMRGIEAIKPDKYLYECGKAIEKYIKKFDYSIVSDYGGHGIGKGFHEDPHVYHFFTTMNKIRLKPGMCFTVEPMIVQGKNPGVVTSKTDGWTVTTKSGKNTAQFEHTVLVTEKGYEILTLPD